VPSGASYLTASRKWQPAQPEGENDGAEEESLAATSIELTQPPRTQLPAMMDPAVYLQSRLKYHKMVYIPPSGGGEKKKKCAAMRKCRVCSAHKWRKETTCMCWTCVAHCKTPCFHKYRAKKLLSKYTEFSIIPHRSDISFKKLL
jgi:hypothetical protein